MNVRYESCPAEPVVFHEYANLFPMLTGDAYDAFVEDVEANGVLFPIVMLGKAILDGRNRYMAARQLGIEYPVTDYEGNDPLAFVWSVNGARRHISESKRAMIAAKVETLQQGRPGKDANLHVKRPDAAKLFNVSERSIASASKVQAKGDDALIESVVSGDVSVSAAADVAELPKPEQAEIVAKGEKEILEAAKRIRAGKAVKRAHVANNGGNNEWYTPEDILHRARAALGGFDLDPASSEKANETVKAERFFTVDDDGLSQEWPIGRIWMNPPYAQPAIAEFCERFVAEIERGSTGIALVNNATETKWFQRLATAATAICFPQGRIKYLDATGEPKGTPLQGQAILYFGEGDAFDAAFQGFGVAVRP